MCWVIGGQVSWNWHGQQRSATLRSGSVSQGCNRLRRMRQSCTGLEATAVGASALSNSLTRPPGSLITFCSSGATGWEP